MLNQMNMDIFKNNNLNIPEPKENQKVITQETVQKSNNSLVVITPQNVSDNQKEDIFWGHFDLSMSKSLKEDNFSKSSSISMSIDIFGYNKNGLTQENKDKLNDVFNGKDFKELKDSFFSLNGSDSSIDLFSNEIDDLFEKISETLDMDSKMLEGPKKLLKFTAIMFSNNLEISKDEVKSDENSNNVITDALATTAKLYGIMGDVENMNKKINDAIILEPSQTIKEYLSDISERYSLNNKENNHQNDLYQTLNRLSKLSQKFNHFL